MVSDSELSTAQARAMVAGRFGMGFLLGLAPLLLAILGLPKNRAECPCLQAWG